MKQPGVKLIRLKLTSVTTTAAVILGPINVNNEVSIEEDDLAFLNEFANEILTGSNDVLMNNKIAAEGEFTV